MRALGYAKCITFDVLMVTRSEMHSKEEFARLCKPDEALTRKLGFVQHREHTYCHGYLAQCRGSSGPWC
jgi:hypothetical protein